MYSYTLLGVQFAWVIIFVFSDLWVRIQALSQNKSCMYLNNFEVIFFWNMSLIDVIYFEQDTRLQIVCNLYSLTLNVPIPDKVKKLS